MYSAVSKSFIAIAIAAAFVACGKSNPDKEAAENFAHQASKCLEEGKYIEAIAYMDSVDQRYPAQIEVRREVMSMRPVAIEQLTIAQMTATDSVIADAQANIQKLEPLMKHISGGTLEGYYVVADAYNPSFINSTGFEPRVNDADFNYYIVAQTIGSRPGISAVEISGDQGAMQSQAVAADSPRRIVVEGSELVTFLPEEVDGLGAWALEHPVKTACIKTDKGDKAVKLTDKQARAFATAYAYSTAKRKLQSAIGLRVKFEHQLQIARDQMANQVADTEE